jgi:hypothetical protein
MHPFIEESSGPGTSRGILSRWACVLGLLHAIGCASGFTFHLL